MQTKICTKCKEEKSLPEFNNSSSNKCKDGKFSWCRTCVSANQKERRLRDIEKVRAYARARYAANPEPARKIMRDRYWRDPDAIRAVAAEWRENNPERCKELARNWYTKNAEEAKSAAKAYHIANRETILVKGRIRSKNHYEKNKDAYYTRSSQRRAAKLGVRGKLSRGIRKRLFFEQNGKCVYCMVDIGLSPHLDHIVPLAKGGSHTDDNVQLLCKSCNLSKGAKMHDEFIEYRKLLATSDGVI